jgi:predicted small integral membrane protein
MLTRLSRMSLVAALALFSTLVVFNNIVDFDTNYQIARHVLSMDTVANAHVQIRALTSPVVHMAFYVCIIVWEALAAVLLWWGGIGMFRARNSAGEIFSRAKRIAAAGLALSMLMWLVAFIDVGGEWFLMWQSPVWNGQQEAFRMFVVTGIVLAILQQRESEQ